MLGKRDAIFWVACAIFAAALLLGATLGDGWLLLAVGAYLLRPTLHSLGVAKQLVDERQMEIHYRASNVGFATLVAGNVVVILALMARGDHAWEMAVAVLVAGLAARALTGLLLVGDPAVGGQRILVSVGLLVAIFAALDAGWPYVLVAVLPGLVVAGLGLIAPRFGRASAIVCGICATAFGTLILAAALARPGGANWGTAVALGLICLPLVAAAACFWRAGPVIDTDTR